MADSVFTQIIRGDIPGEIVYQDDLCAVIMTIEPVSPGHCLVIPKEPVEQLWDVNDDLYIHLQNVVKKVALAMRKAYNYPRVGQLVEGFGVPHAHIHLIGLRNTVEKIFASHASYKHIVSDSQLALEADKIRKFL